MASITNLMGSNSGGGIYGNRNIISGLATGMDTESLIQNAVSGYKLKLTNLQQQRTKVEWQQTAMRSIIDKMVAFDKKYLSFSSGTNLLSSTFFDSAVKISAQGVNSNKVIASGRLTTDVAVNSVDKLATSSKYQIGSSGFAPSNTAIKDFDIKEQTTVGTLSGSITLGYGGKNISISFNENDVFNTPEEMVNAINKKLEEQSISFDSGTQGKASEYIKAVTRKNYDGQDIIAFETVKADDGNGVWIDSANSSIKDVLGIDPDSEKKDTTNFVFDKSKITEVKTMVDKLAKDGFTITVDGISKVVNAPTKDELNAKNAYWTESDYLELLQKNIDKEFGQGQLTVSNASTAGGNNIRLKFDSPEGKSFSVSSTASEVIGMDYDLTSYTNTYRKLDDIIPGTDWDKWAIEVKDTDVKESDDGKYHVDQNGNRVAKDDKSGKWYRVDEDGNKMVEFKVNGKVVGTFSKTDRLDDVISEINRNENSDVTLSFSKFTGNFVFTSKQSGEGQKIEFDKDGLSGALFGGTVDKPGKFTSGQDAEFTVTVNGEERNVKQHSNTINIDGLNVTMKETFTKDSGTVTFTSASDADKIINVVKDMVKDFNEMATEIKNAYSTLPLQKSKGKYYEPLTEKDLEGMTDSAIKAYEEKAKTGILFADSDLRALYEGISQSLSVLGVTDNDANKLGLTTSFKDGLTTITLDEDKLRKALEEDPEKVKNIFTQSTANGAKTDGLMQGLKTQLDKYARTTGAVKGVLIEKAGSTLAPTSVFQNVMQTKLKDFDRQIELWQDKLSDKIDFYNHKFTKLEMLVSQMNGQSGILMGMSGGGM